ncbi:MAG: bacteriohemerythrin [Roseburia sp.]
MFQFTDDCVLGVEQIDEEHRHLFDLVNRGMDILHNSYTSDWYEDIKELLAELEDYAENHFTHEEAYMEKIRDPELILQRSQHMAFRDTIRNFSLKDIDDNESQKKVLEDLMKYLAKWLYHHIIGSDIMIGKLPPLEEWMIRENPCEFTEEYRTGIDLIDKEHEELFHIVDKANKIMRFDIDEEDINEIMDIIHELHQYAELHFKDEEEYMESINYEGLAAQKRAHEAFIDKVENIDMDEIHKNPKEYIQSLVEFLLGWLINHILYSDKKIPRM